MFLFLAEKLYSINYNQIKSETEPKSEPIESEPTRLYRDQFKIN